MACRKLFTTSNKVGYGVRYVPGMTQISSQHMGGVCLAMVLTWVKEALRYEASGKSIALTEHDITGGSLNRIAMLHHSLKFRMRYAREHGLAQEVLDEIKADYLYAFGLQEVDQGYATGGDISSVAQELLMLAEGYHLMVICSADSSREHAFGFRADSSGGKSYFLDPNAGLWEYDDDFEMFRLAGFFIKTNYGDKQYLGGVFGTSKLEAR